MKDVREASTFISRQVESSRLFFLDPAEDEDFTVVFGGFERCRTDYRIDRRNFPWFCLEFVNRGHGRLHLGETDHELRPGSFFGAPEFLVGNCGAGLNVQSACYPICYSLEVTECAVSSGSAACEL